jgi:hypothetical protein
VRDRLLGHDLQWRAALHRHGVLMTKLGFSLLCAIDWNNHRVVNQVLDAPLIGVDPRDSFGTFI